MKCSIGLRISPREIQTYDLTIESMKKTGWNSGYIFAEPGLEINEKDYPEFKIVRRKERLNCFKNMYDGLVQMREEEPDSEYYGMIQDDVLFCRGVRQYYEKSLELSEVLRNAGVVSVFTPRLYSKKNHFGWHNINKGRHLEMAQTFFFSPKAVDSIIEFFPDERESSLFKYYFTDDNRIGWWARENDFEVVYHTPSLSQHIGHTSSCWDSQPTSVWRRSASDFVGEEFDLLDLMNPVG